MLDTKTCDCKFCQVGKRIRLIADKLDVDDKKFLIDYHNESICVGSDLEYYEAIMDGSWPNAEEILTRALERVKTTKNKIEINSNVIIMDNKYGYGPTNFEGRVFDINAEVAKVKFFIPAYSDSARNQMVEVPLMLLKVVTNDYYPM